MPKYARGEKVFAKVRGYPPWPARVEGVADETPNKMKYHIYFYGTAETAICKADELFPYVENRAKYGKPLKKRGFNEALQEVDEELGLTGINFLESSVTDDSFADTSVAEDETSVGSLGNVSKEGLHRTETPKGTRRKLDVQDNQEQEGKKSTSGKKSRIITDQLLTPVTGKQQEVVSRSGRKIKPKKFADEQVDDNSGSPQSATNHSTPVSSINKSVDDRSTVSNNDLKIVVPEQKLPTVCTTDSAEKHKKESEEKQKEETQEKHKETKEKCSPANQSDSNDTEKIIPECLLTERELLRIDVGLKDSLDLKKAHPERALDLLDELLQLKINRLMFKKHPEVYDTTSKLRKYVGCVQNWNMSDDEVREFNEKAAQIQEKAKEMHEKIKSVFGVPEDKSFSQFYNDQLAEFANKTKNMAQDEIFKLVEDPTDENVPDVAESTD